MQCQGELPLFNLGNPRELTVYAKCENIFSNFCPDKALTIYFDHQKPIPSKL